VSYLDRATMTHLIRTIEYRPLAEGSAGTFESLDAMKAAVLGQIPPDYSGYLDQRNRRAAEKICAGVSSHNSSAQIAALFNYVTHRIKYVPHPANEQRVQDCQRTLEIGSGDCVSKSVCLATLLTCLGHVSRFVAQCLDGDSYSHVYVECQVRGSYLALDCVASDKPMGWFQPVPDNGFETTWPIFT
jgi:transglutaminase-like putative cysteine protease